MRIDRFTKWVVIVNCAVPVTLLAWDALNGHLGANPVNFAIRTTGILSLNGIKERSPDERSEDRLCSAVSPEEARRSPRPTGLAGRMPAASAGTGWHRGQDACPTWTAQAHRPYQSPSGLTPAATERRG